MATHWGNVRDGHAQAVAAVDAERQRTTDAGHRALLDAQRGHAAGSRDHAAGQAAAHATLARAKDQQGMAHYTAGTDPANAAHFQDQARQTMGN